MGRPSGRTERRDAKVMADRAVVAGPVRKLVDLVQMRNRVASHETPSLAAVPCVPPRPHRVTRRLVKRPVLQTEGTNRSAAPVFGNVP